MGASNDVGVAGGVPALKWSGARAGAAAWLSALTEPLPRGRIAAAALDVLEVEPPPADHPLLAQERCLVTPHMAWYTEQASKRMRRLASREVARTLRGERPANPVNPEVLERDG